MLSSQVTRNLPELAFWEEHLGMRIEGVGVADHLKIVYTHIIDSDWTKEFFFVVSMVTRDYESTLRPFPISNLPLITRSSSSY